MDIIAGIMLIIANILFALGYAYYSTYFFLITNISFLINSAILGSYFGAFTILVGIIAQLYILIKMIRGEYHKKLNN